VVLPMLCHEDEQTAIDRGLDGGTFGYSLAHYYFGPTGPASPIWDEFQAKRAFGFDREIAAQTGQPGRSRSSAGSARCEAPGTPAQSRR
jgi:hypothetical protein